MTLFKQLSVSRRLTGLVGFALLAMLILTGSLVVSERSLIMQ